MSAEENRVMVVAPFGQDAEAMAELLRAQGVMAEACAGPGECVEGLKAGAGALLMTEEALELSGAEELLETLQRQPAWSELPLIILTSGGESRFERLLEIGAEVGGGATLLERPMREGTLLRTVQVALRSRQRQYQVRDLMAERERREAALRESEERLRLGASAARLFAFEWDPISDCVRREGDAQSVLGVPFKEETGKAFFERIHPADRERFVRVVSSLIPGQDVYQTSYRVLRPDGRETVLEESGRAFFDEGGRFVRLIGMTADITARNQAEQALQESEARLRATLRSAADEIWIVDAQGRLISISDSVMENLGVGSHKWDHVEAAIAQLAIYRADGSPRPREENILPRGLRDEVIRNELEMIRNLATGQLRWREVSGAPVHDAEGRRIGAVAVARDITARRKAEEALRESEERFRSLADGTPVPIWVHDAEGGLRFVNRAWSDFFGKTLEQANGENWRPLVNAEDVLGYAGEFLRCHTERREFHAQARVQRHDGQWRWIESFGAPRFSGTGEYLGMAGSSVDITTRKESEAVLARSREELERLVAERTAALREMVGELEHFSYSITHDMRAPLRAMMGFAEVVKELSSESAHREQQVFLERIETAARRMDLLITDALNYSKAVRSELPLAPVDVGRLLRGMVDTYPELQVAQGGIRIEPELPLVMGNEAGLTQCFSNLLVNAVKFTKPGEVPVIRVWADGATSESRQHKAESGEEPVRSGCVRIWVEDGGIGIGPGMLPRLFHMFSRGTSEQAGTGIGLALVRKVVDRMGGRVGVESQEGKGSRFWVELRSGDVMAKH